MLRHVNYASTGDNNKSVARRHQQAPKGDELDEDFPEDAAAIQAAVNDSCLCHSRDILGGDLQGLFIDHPVQTPRQCQGSLSHDVCKGVGFTHSSPFLANSRNLPHSALLLNVPLT